MHCVELLSSSMVNLGTSALIGLAPSWIQTCYTPLIIHVVCKRYLDSSDNFCYISFRQIVEGRLVEDIIVLC